ncbi:MaoC family dehydratase N-terminal domain-containing protein [Chloroflexota bacterium]
MSYEYLPKKVSQLIGQETKPVLAQVAVEKALIEQFCEAFEDGNPIYTDEEYARLCGYDYVVAPPGALLMWSKRFVWTPLEGREEKEKDDLHYRLKQLMNRSVGIIQKVEIEYHKHLLLGDKVSVIQRIKNVSPEKETRLGVGNFWTIDSVYANQKGECVAIVHLTHFAYDEKQT